MDSVPDKPVSAHRVLHHRLTESLGPIYLTALSVIQGVALADLASVVQASYEDFTVLQWLLAGINFAMLIIIWNAYTIQSTLWEWIPDLRDAVAPFLFGAVELFLNHAITLSLSAWLTALALLSAVGVLANVYIIFRSQEEPQNAGLSTLMLASLRLRWEILYLLGCVIIIVLFAVVSHVAGLQATDNLATGRGIAGLTIVVLASTGIAVYVSFSARNWRQVVTYTRTGEIPAAKQR
jgi:hypothetical protein